MSRITQNVYDRLFEIVKASAADVLSETIKAESIELDEEEHEDILSDILSTLDDVREFIRDIE